MVWLKKYWNNNILILYHPIPTFNDPKKGSFENIVGKGENAGNQHFLKMFSTIPKTNISFFSYIYFVVCKCFEFGRV